MGGGVIEKGAGMMVWILRVAAPLGGLAILLATVPRLFEPEVFRGFHLPMVALELVENEEEVERVMDELGEQKIRSNLNADYVFIGIYTLALLRLGFWLFRRDMPRARPLGLLLGLCTLGAASFDVVENARTSAMLDDTSRTVIDGVRHAALAKWALFFAATGVLAAVFLPRKGWGLVAGGFCLAISVLGALGLVWQRSLIEYAFILVGLALAPSGEALRELSERP